MCVPFTRPKLQLSVLRTIDSLVHYFNSCPMFNPFLLLRANLGSPLNGNASMMIKISVFSYPLPLVVALIL